MEKRNVKFYVALLLVFMVMVNYAMPVYANTQINSSICELANNDLYDVYESKAADLGTITSAYVTRQVIYTGIVTPSKELSWTETLNGGTYSGTLYLSRVSYDFDGNQTIATYCGALDKQ